PTLNRYWDRSNRPDQLVTALPAAMRVLTDPVETGAVTVCLPQDVQTEAYDYPEAFFAQRIWRIPRNRPDRDGCAEFARSAAQKTLQGSHTLLSARLAAGTPSPPRSPPGRSARALPPARQSPAGPVDCCGPSSD